MAGRHVATTGQPAEVYHMNHTEFFEKLKVGYIARAYLVTGEEN